MRNYSNLNFNALLFLIAANILIFIVSLVSPAIIYFLGLTPAFIWQQPWTIITNMFVHGSFTHILFNMISLYFLGSFLIRLVGEKNFLKIYFLGGIAGNILYILLAPSLSVGIGASGAIFALGGALAILAPKLKVFVFFIPIPMPLWAAMLFFLVISLFVASIAWEAHLGGFLLGLIAGYFLKRGRQIYYA